MKPFDLEVYDSYLAYLDHLLTLGQALADHPFEDLLKVNDRMAMTHRYHAPGVPVPVILTDETVQAQRRMIETAKAFRDSVMVQPDPAQQATT